MNLWSDDELQRIAEADELQLASRRSDGTLRTPVTIWVVRHGEGLYVRSAYGRTSGWFRGAQDRHEGQIAAGGVEKDVRFADASVEHARELDDAYRTKYGHYSAAYTDPMVSPRAREATLQLVPHPDS